MARHVVPREPQSEDFSERADSQSDDIYASIQAARASEYSDYTATASATQDGDSTVALFTPSPSSDDGTLYVIQTSTLYASGSPTASRYTGTSSLLTASDTGAAYLNPSSISNANTAASTSIPSNAGLAESASETTSAVASSQHHDDGLSGGELAVAIVLPILAALALVLLAFFLLRRRAQKTRGSNGNGGASFLPGLREKWGSLRSSSTSQHRTEMETAGGAPVVTSRENNAYFTGLDTSSLASGSAREAQHSGEYYGRTSDGGTTFDVPPPAYTVKAQNRGAPVLPPLQVDNTGSTLAPPTPAPDFLDPPQSSARSAVSISSTLYSDTASIHSARAARMSTGGLNVIRPGLHNSRSGSLGQGRDPFSTPSTSSRDGSPVENISPMAEK